MTSDKQQKTKTSEKQQQRRSISSIDSLYSNSSSSSTGSNIKKGKYKIKNISIKKQKKNYAVSIIEGSNNSSNDIKSCFCCCATIIGGMYSLVEKRDGTPIIIAGPTWPTCLFFTFPMIIFGSISTIWFVLMDVETDMPWWITPIYISFVTGTLVSLFLTGCSNPGLVERITEENKDAEMGDWRWNGELSSFQPPHSAYCEKCKVLIEEYEHECPWTGTAIGKGNALAFYMFLSFVNVWFYFTIALIVWHFILVV